MYLCAFILAVVLAQAKLAKDAALFFSSDYAAQHCRGHTDYANYTDVVQSRLLPKYVCKAFIFRKMRLSGCFLIL